MHNIARIHTTSRTRVCKNTHDIICILQYELVLVEGRRSSFISFQHKPASTLRATESSTDNAGNTLQRRNDMVSVPLLLFL